MRTVQAQFIYDPAYFVGSDTPTQENAETLREVAIMADNLAGNQEGYDITVTTQEGAYGIGDMVGSVDAGGWNKDATGEIVNQLFAAFITNLHNSWDEREEQAVKGPVAPVKSTRGKME